MENYATLMIAHMQCFFINIASHDGLLACVTEDAVISSETVDHRIGDHELLPLVEKVIAEAQSDKEE